MAVIFFDGWILFKSGSKYDKVFPVPVGAVTIIFLFSIKAGITCVWTAVGFLKPRYYNPLISPFLRLYFLNFPIKIT